MPPGQKKNKNPLQHLLAGGCAGFVESSICHPLDTIKTRMQLRRQAATVEAIQARSSLMEPAMKLSHSLVEPVSKAVRGGSPSVLKMAGAATAGGAIHEPAAARIPLGKFKPPPPQRELAKMTGAVVAPMGPVGTARRIIQREGFTALYKGLTAVWTGIVPKMAIRFVSFEYYKEVLGSWTGHTGSSMIFVAGLSSGLTEAILVVTPAEVCKIRMQSQYNSMADPSQLAKRKYTNVIQTAFVIVREEGIGALYKGVVPTMLRQGCNQAVNFTAYQYLKTQWMNYQGTTSLESHQSLLIGGFSGGMGPIVNNPLDVVKTRLQKQVVVEGKVPKYTGLMQGCRVIAAEEGVLALWKGITPRLMRIVPGQAITFMTYEFVSSKMHQYGVF